MKNSTDRSATLFDTERCKLETIFACSPVAMTLLRGPSFVFEIVNQSWSDLVSPRSYIGRTWVEAYPELLNSPLIGRLTDVLQTGEAYTAHEMELLVKGPHGELGIRYYDFSYVRICDPQNRPYGVYCNCSDVTERVQSRRLLEQSQLRLKEAVETRDAFLAIASHELRTPLTSWKLQTQTAQRAFRRSGSTAFTVEKMGRLIDSSVAHVERLEHLVDAMLDASQIAAGKLSMHFIPVDLSSLVRSTVEDMMPCLRGAGCEVVLNVPDDSVMASLDPLRIAQVLKILLTNAMKYAPDAPVHVDLSVAAQIARLTVRDHGLGIPPVLRVRIFERFERLISASEVSGLGLGLHIAMQIVVAHGGHLEATEPDGHGAALVATIPTHCIKSGGGP